MSQRCPVCKSRLWTDPIFTPSRLVCPRCGAVFRPTVPWAAFRILVGIVLVLSITLVFFLVRHKPWLVAFLAVLFLFFWFLPRLVNLQHISNELGLSEGVMDPDRMRLKFDDKFVEKQDQAQEERQFRTLLFLFLMVVILALALIWVVRS
ncbi:MAG: hypothetical protein EHM61_17610 [Acidobacteria bacterium]|nr:MAG: hypothetical protein EHM61_17610 [Acidobacteriota bacterium]